MIGIDLIPTQPLGSFLRNTMSLKGFLDEILHKGSRRLAQPLLAAVDRLFYHRDVPYIAE
jgi:hypothetical protein